MPRKYKKSNTKKPKRKTYKRSLPPGLTTQTFEKKTYTSINFSEDQILGQVENNAKGYYIVDTSPAPSQGTSSVTRIGQKIGVCSGHWDFQFIQQSSAALPIRGIIEVFYTDIPQTIGSTVGSQLYNSNPFVTGASIIDYNSSRDTNYMKNFRRVCYKKFYIKPDNYNTQVLLTTVKMGFKVKKPYVFRISDAGTLGTGQFIMMIRCDVGNCGGGTSTLGGIATGTPATGLTFNYGHKTYYYDN